MHTSSVTDNRNDDDDDDWTTKGAGKPNQDAREAKQMKRLSYSHNTDVNVKQPKSFMKHNNDCVSDRPNQRKVDVTHFISSQRKGQGCLDNQMS